MRKFVNTTAFSTKLLHNVEPDAHLHTVPFCYNRLKNLKKTYINCSENVNCERYPKHFKICIHCTPRLKSSCQYPALTIYMHTYKLLKNHFITHFPRKLRVSFIMSANGVCHWTVHYSVVFQQTDSNKRVGGKQTRLKALTDSMCASNKRNSYHNDFHWLTLQSLKPKLAAILIKMYIYQAQLQ